jgi:abequosyltransferase
MQGTHEAPASGVRLSVCMPVYNFADFLGPTLDSILAQLAPGVEVLVVDGASTDRTAEVVAARAASCPQLRYELLARRGGIDADIAESVERARGEYCWLFSGDDIMRPGALGRALECLRTREDVYLCRHTYCDEHMRFLFDYPILRRDEMCVVEFGDPVARAAHLKQAVNTEALFSFMGGLVIRREKWLSVPMPQAFAGSCWAHAARLIAAAGAGGLRVRYVAEIWLDKRGGNDSFMDRGLVNRLRILIDGYLALAAAYFGGGSMEAAEVRRLLRNEVGLKVLVYARGLTDDTPQRESRSELDHLVSAIYADRSLRNWLVRQIYRLTPVFVNRALRNGYLLLRRVGIRVRPPPLGTS